MCINTGILVHKVISQNYENYPLLNMISPSFQNQGDATVYVHGRALAKGDSFTVNVPGIVLQNDIAITFENDISKSRVLHLHFVQPNP